MIFAQLAHAATMFAKFHAGSHADTRKSLLELWPFLLEQGIKSVLTVPDCRNENAAKFLTRKYG